MSHTYCRQYIHIIYATKNFLPLIAEDTLDSLYAYTTAIIKEFGGWLIDRSGTSDHVHLLINLSTDCSISDMLRQIKACSSKWYRQQSGVHSTFGWNDGYAAFTVSPSSVDNVKQYFLNEKTRHQKNSFLSELAGFMKLHDIEYKPEYLGKSTFTKLVYHLVWSVKNREPMISSSLKPTLHESIRQEIETYSCKLLALDNVADHIHLLVELPASISTAHLMQKIKTASSTHVGKMINLNLNLNLKAQPAKFNWQEGFGVFSVGKPALETVKNYVFNQEEHHSKNKESFDEEWNKLIAGNFL